MQLRLFAARQDREQLGKVCISVLAGGQLALTCLISQVFKSFSLPSQAHSSPISLIKVRLTLPVKSQVGHTAFMLGHAHYSDTLPVPPWLEAAHNARHHQPRDLGTLKNFEFIMGQWKWNYKLFPFDTTCHAFLICVRALFNGCRRFTVYMVLEAVEGCFLGHEIASACHSFEHLHVYRWHKIKWSMWL